MDNETLFYVCGIAAAVSAVVVSIIGLKVKSFPGKAFPLVVLWFAILVGGAATFSVLHAKDEEHHKEAEFEKAGHEFEAEGADEEAAGNAEGAGEGEGPGGESSAEPEAAVKGPGGTLQLAANPTDIAYEQASLSSKPGKVTIDFDNPSAIGHDVAIENEAGEEVAGTEVIAEAKTEVSAELAPGTYTFYCTVPGHREAGMEGPLEVQ
jgi:plastocyanin